MEVKRSTKETIEQLWMWDWASGLLRMEWREIRESEGDTERMAVVVVMEAEGSPCLTLTVRFNLVQERAGAAVAISICVVPLLIRERMMRCNL